MKNIFLNPWKAGEEYNSGEVLDRSKVIDTSYTTFNEFEDNLINKDSTLVEKCTTILGTQLSVV